MGLIRFCHHLDLEHDAIYRGLLDLDDPSFEKALRLVEIFVSQTGCFNISLDVRQAMDNTEPRQILRDEKRELHGKKLLECLARQGCCDPIQLCEAYARRVSDDTAMAESLKAGFLKMKNLTVILAEQCGADVGGIVFSFLNSSPMSDMNKWKQVLG